jgi:phosphate/sulfate permease
VDFLLILAFIGIGMLIWDCVEVGRNDAANLVNAVVGARVMKRQIAVAIAAVAVIMGATFSAPVMETARKGIFDPTVLTIQMALAIYVSVYIVDTVMLFAFSGFGMPVSTTACLVFELVGAAWFLAGHDNVNWPKVGAVTQGILFSIAISGLASFLVMRVFRGAIRDQTQDRETVHLHGPWITGAMVTWLGWFMVFKGLKNVEAIKGLKEQTFDVYGEGAVLLAMWGVMTLLSHLVLVVTNKSGHKYMFSLTAVLGMICLAFAFGQNDLANAASPGLAGLALWRDGGAPTDLADIASEIKIDKWALFGCGFLMACGMFTIYAQRVTRAQINTGSQYDEVALYAPGWCRRVARFLIYMWPSTKALAPPSSRSESGKKVHYDTLRASVITGVSASVIAFASGRGLPVSTTYVAFAAVLGSGLADRIFARGDAEVKAARAVWVISCWFIAPIIAIVATGFVAYTVYHFTYAGLVLCIFANVGVRYLFKKHADKHEQTHHQGSGETSTDEGSNDENAAEGTSTENE